MTGANGFVASALCDKLERDGHLIIRSVRQRVNTNEIQIDDLSGSTNWQYALKNKVDVAIHLAAINSLAESASDLSCKHLASVYSEANTEGTRQLALQCAEAGVKRFIFISSAKVLGEGRNQTYRSDDPANPIGAYATSKWEAELSLAQIREQTGMEVVILRPPMVYGPGVKGNFLKFLQAVEQRLPLPFGAINNRRSLIYLGNLIDAIDACMFAPVASGKTWLISDDDDVSTPELVRRIAKAMNLRTYLFPLPINLMLQIGRLINKESVIDRLVSSLTVDIQPIREELGWSPPYTMQEGLKTTVDWYQQTQKRK